MNKNKRILTELIIGATIIGTSLIYQDEIQGLINNGAHPKAQEITKNINLRLDQRLPLVEGFLNLPTQYRPNPFSLSKYQNWIENTIIESKSNNNYAIIIDKAAYTLQLYQNGEKIEEFPVEFGRNSIDDKFLESDMTTPEGIYKIKKIKNTGNTNYHKAYLLNYPNESDKKKFEELKERGFIPSFGTSVGSLIEIHGNGSAKGKNNWTFGCIALSNENIDKLFNYNLEENTPITIVRYGTKTKY